MTRLVSSGGRPVLYDLYGGEGGAGTGYDRERVESGCVAVDPLPGWYRDGIVCGERRWVTDEVRGRAGVWFREIVEAAA